MYCKNIDRNQLEPHIAFMRERLTKMINVMFYDLCDIGGSFMMVRDKYTWPMARDNVHPLLDLDLFSGLNIIWVFLKVCVSFTVRFSDHIWYLGFVFLINDTQCILALQY